MLRALRAVFLASSLALAVPASIAASLVLPSPTAGAASSSSVASTAPVQARLAVQSAAVRGGEAFWAALVLEVEAGWHVYGEEPGGTGLPTLVEWDLPPGFTVEEALYPPTRRYVDSGIESFGMEGRVVILARLHPPAGLAAGPLRLAARASWLACKEACIPGEATLELALASGPGVAAAPTADAGLLRDALAVLGLAAQGGDVAVAPASAPVTPTAGPGLLLALLLALGGGLLLNLMPCVLPVLSLKVTGLVRRGGAGGGEGLKEGLAYGAGILSAFLGLAVVIIVMKIGGASAGWGFQFQEPAVVALTAWLFLLVALNLFGVFEFGLGIAGRAGGAASRGGRRHGRLASFGEGFLATFAATPCTAPFMGAALGWALAQPAAATLAVFAALGVGMAAPFVLLAARPGLLSRLPPPGRWMESLKMAMGFPMLATTLWLASILAGLAGSAALFRLLSGLVACALGAWIWGRWGGLAASRRSRLVAAILALVLVLGGAAFGALGARVGARAAAASPGASAVEPDIARGSPRALLAGWEAWSPARVAGLRAAGKPVFVAFTADWCLSCKVNEAAVLDTAPVQARFREAGVALLLADWTAPDEAIARALAENGRAGVPLYLLYPAGGAAPRILPEILTRSMVFAALDSLDAARP